MHLSKLILFFIAFSFRTFQVVFKSVDSNSADETEFRRFLTNESDTDDNIEDETLKTFLLFFIAKLL